MIKKAGLRQPLVWFLGSLSFVFSLASYGSGGPGSYGGVAKPAAIPKINNVFGDDDRRDVHSRQFPWSTMGYLNSGCTVTLVGERLALTAAHCVYDKASASLKHDLVAFEANPRLAKPGQAAPSAPISFAWIGSRDPEKERGGDWALLYLSRPLGQALGYMTVKVVDFAAALPYAVNLAGYSADRWQGGAAAGVANEGLPGLSVHQACSVRRIVIGGRHLHDCDATSGVSGGPVYIGGDEGVAPEVVGISVSEYRRGAEGSVHRAVYADLDANVAISAAAFASAWEQLRSQVDQSAEALPAAELAEVLQASHPKVTALAAALPPAPRDDGQPAAPVPQQPTVGKPELPPVVSQEGELVQGLTRIEQLLAWVDGLATQRRDRILASHTQGMLRQTRTNLEALRYGRQVNLNLYWQRLQFYHGLLANFASRHEEAREGLERVLHELAMLGQR